MKVQEKDIIPGAVFYEVSCVGRFDGNPHLMRKVLVTSYVNTENDIQEKWFLCEDDYRNYGFDWVDTESHHFLNDCGIGESKLYNLHRLFTTESSALAFVEECKSGKFTDPADQYFYDNDDDSWRWDDDWDDFDE